MFKTGLGIWDAALRGLNVPPIGFLTTQDFASADWQAVGVTKVGAVAGPDGVANSAYQITFAAGATNQLADTLDADVAVGTYRFSVWARHPSATKPFRLKFWTGAVDAFSGDMTATTTWQQFSFDNTGDVVDVSIANNTGGGAGDLYLWRPSLILIG